VLVARDADLAVGTVVGYTSESSPARQPVTVGISQSMYVRRDARANGMDANSQKRSWSGTRKWLR